MNSSTDRAVTTPPLRPFDRLPRRPWFLVGDTTLGEWHEERESREAYDWMRRQMNSRLGSTSGGILWLWARTGYRDLIGSTQHARGEVLLTVRVPRARVLLSHFDDWHSVLNRSLDVPLLPGETHEEWSVRFDAIREARDERELPCRDLPIDQWPFNLRADLEASWESIFGPTTWRDNAHRVQATGDELFSNEVVRAIRIS